MSPLLGRPNLAGRHIVLREALLAVAILLASAPLSGLLAGPSWFLLTAAGALPVIIAGTVLRRVVRRAPLVPLLQVVVIALVVLVIELFQGLVGLEEGPLGIIRAQAEIFPAAVNELASGLAPMVVGGRGSIVVILLIALITLALDLMFIDLGWHTPIGLLLLASLLVPALQHPSGGAWWTVAGPVLAGLLVFSARTVHADPTYIEGDSRPQAGPLSAPARTAAVTAIACVLVAALAVPVGQVLPQLAPSRVALNIDLINEWQDRDMPQLGPVMIDDDVSVRRSLLEQDETEVLRYTTTDAEPSYLRLRTLTRFDGEAYQDAASADGEAATDLDSASFSDARTDGMAVSGSTEELIEHDVVVTSLGGNRLPAPDNLRSLDTSSEEVDERVSVLATDGELSLGRVGANIIGLNYQILSEPSPATADGLRRVDPAVFEEPFDVGYTSRDQVPDVTVDLAARVADNADAETAFDTALAYQDYFRNSFAYSLTVRTPPGQDPLESFLDDQIGYCEQFAAAFALMMTAQGYPTRVAIGFTAGQIDGDEWSVTSRNAHAWPEVWFGPQYGWVPFEPTPAAAANGVREPGVTDETPGEEDIEEPLPEETTATEEDSDGETSEEDSDEEDSEAADEEDSAGPSLLDEQGEPTAGVQSSVVALLMAAAVIAVAGLVVVALIRRRRVQAREERWAALVAGMAPDDEGRSGGGPGGERLSAGAPGGVAAGGGPAGDAPGGGPGGDAPGGSPDSPGSPGAGMSGGEGSVTAELVRRRAGELAWSELRSELTVRARAITWLGWTGGWGRPPREISLDPALPPARALEALLDDIDAGNVEVGEEDRAAGARIAAAYSAATYAAPLPQDAVDAIDAARTGAPGRDAAGTDALGGDVAGNDAAGTGAAGTDAAGTGAAGTDAAGTDAARPSAESRDPRRPLHSWRYEGGEAPTVQRSRDSEAALPAPPPLRADTDRLIALIRAAR